MQLEPAGSVDVIKKVTETKKPADVVASADYALIPKNMIPNDADWYLTFAKNSMVLTVHQQEQVCRSDNSRQLVHDL